MPRETQYFVETPDGKEISFTPQEQKIIRYNQQIINSLGYEIPITTLTAITKSVVEQKFYTVPFADYLPVRVGDGAWSTNLITYREFSDADDFTTGLVNTGASNTRLAEADAGVDSITVQVNNWVKSISWSLFDIQQAIKAGNWDLITAKERSRKKNWDLGIQQVAFWGVPGNSNINGLLTLPGVNSNTALITQPINAMTASQFATFLGGAYEAYRSNCNRTAIPTHFILPEPDYNGLSNTVDETFPLKTRLQRLKESFETMTNNKNFKILASAYAAESQNSAVTGLNKNRYVMLNYDQDSIRMDIPVDYANTLQNSVNNFQWQNAGYGQFTGAAVYRPLETLYFDYAT